MVSRHVSLRELEEAQQEEKDAARRRIDLAEEGVWAYRTRIHQVQEAFFSLSASEGIADDPGFRSDLQRVTEITDENIHRTGRMIAELEEEYEELGRQHERDRETFIEQQRQRE
jgi:hypothetical protein